MVCLAPPYHIQPADISVPGGEGRASSVPCHTFFLACHWRRSLRERPFFWATIHSLQGTSRKGPVDRERQMHAGSTQASSISIWVVDAPPYVNITFTDCRPLLRLILQTLQDVSKLPMAPGTVCHFEDSIVAPQSCGWCVPNDSLPLCWK